MTAQGNTLSDCGESKAEEERAGQNWLLRERLFGACRRSLTLPRPINADQAEAQYENGVLTLTLPKAELGRRGGANGFDVARALASVARQASPRQ